MGARILICDDDPFYSQMLQDGLELEGYSVMRTIDTDQLAVWISAYGAPDLFILDFQMAGGGGPAAVKALKAAAATAHIPIIMSSAMPAAQQEKWFKDVKGITFLHKPFELKKMLATVKKLLSVQQP